MRSRLKRQAAHLPLVFLPLTSLTSGFFLMVRRLWLRLRGLSRGRGGGWGTASVSDQHSSSVSVSCRPPALYPVWRRGGPRGQHRAFTVRRPRLSLGGCQPFWDISESLCPLTDGWSVAGHLVLQVEGVLVVGGVGVGDGAQVLHGEAAQPSGQCILTLQGRGSGRSPEGGPGLLAGKGLSQGSRPGKSRLVRRQSLGQRPQS